MAIPTSTKEIYTLKRKVLVAQYSKIVTPYKQFHDDRRIAYNIYNMALEVCDQMIATNDIITSTSIRIAVTNYLNEMREEMDEIINRFDHTTSKED